MDMKAKADLIERTELGLEDYINKVHQIGLTYHDLLRILMLQLEETLIKFEAETHIKPT